MASLNHVGLTVTDLDASVAFYVDAVGWSSSFPGSGLAANGSTN